MRIMTSWATSLGSLMTRPGLAWGLPLTLVCLVGVVWFSAGVAWVMVFSRSVGYWCFCVNSKQGLVSDLRDVVARCFCSRTWFDRLPTNGFYVRCSHRSLPAS